MKNLLKNDFEIDLLSGGKEIAYGNEGNPLKALHKGGLERK